MTDQQNNNVANNINWSNAVGLKVVLKTIHNHRHLPFYTFEHAQRHNSNDTIEGEIFCYDPQLQLLALYESGGQHASSTRKTFRLLNTNMISEIVKISDPADDDHHHQQQQLSQQQQQQGSKSAFATRQQAGLASVPFKDTRAPLPPVNLDKLKEREQRALHERQSRLGHNVTNDGQYIFDQLSKTFPVRWKRSSISSNNSNSQTSASASSGGAAAQDSIVVMDEFLIQPPYSVDHVRCVEGISEAQKNHIQRALAGVLVKLEKLKSQSFK